MKRSNCTAVCVAAGAFLMWAPPAFAYFGPGVGLSAIGVFLALIVGMIVAFFGFIWYPVKRFLRRRKTQAHLQAANVQVEVVDKGT